MHAYQPPDERHTMRATSGQTYPIPYNAVAAELVARAGIYDCWLQPATYRAISGTFDRPFLHDVGTHAWGVETPADVLALEHTLDALKCRAAGPTPSWRGLTLLKRWEVKHPERFRADSDPPELPQDTAPNLTKPLPYSPRRRYLTAIDQHGAYLAASRTVPLGYGALKPTKNLVFQPGIWHVKRGQTQHDFHAIPADGWYDTSTLRVAYQDGQPFDILAGYVWTDRSTALRGWSELLGNAITPETKPFIKRIYTRTMGKIGSTGGLPGTWYRHPDWWRAIVAASALRLWWLALNVLEVYGLSVDTAYIVTEETTDLPEKVTERLGEKPGQYRVLWTKPLPPPVQRLFGRIPATKLAEEMGRYEAIA